MFIPEPVDLNDPINIIFLKNKQDSIANKLFKDYFVPNSLVRQEQ